MKAQMTVVKSPRTDPPKEVKKGMSLSEILALIGSGKRHQADMKVVSKK